MRKRLRHYFIGKYLDDTDVFEKARAIMLYQFSLMFFFTFLFQVATDFILEFYKALVLHIADSAIIFSLPFLLKHSKKLDTVINLFFTVCLFSSLGAFMMLSPLKIDIISVSWVMFFVSMSALLQRGKARILYCCFLAWMPMIYVLINIQLKGALTWHFVLEPDTEEPPLFLIFIPMLLCAYGIWSHTYTIQKAKDTITQQKQIIEEKNKDITDSIVYARRIQRSLLPQEKHIEKELNRLKKNKPDKI